MEVHGGVKVLAVEPILEPFHRRKAAGQLLAGPPPKGCSGGSKAANLRQRRPREDDEDQLEFGLRVDRWFDVRLRVVLAQAQVSRALLAGFPSSQV